MTPEEIEDQKDLYAVVGVTLVQLQAVETMMTFCMGVVFTDSDGKTLFDLTNPKTRRQTFGQFITRLRQRSELDPRFDTVLGNFLDHRNQFVHHLTQDSRMKFDSQKGRDNLRVFIGLLCTELDTVSKTLLGFIMRWADPDKYSDLSHVRIQFAEGSYFGEAEQIFAPHTTKLVRPKPRDS
jgi:hypothetical protein